MGTTASSQLRYPELSDTPDVPRDVKNLAEDLDKIVIPKFTSTSARDAQITAPQSGQVCYVDNTALGSHTLMVYRNGWRAMCETPIVRRQTSRQTWTSTTTPTNTDLTWPVEANTNYTLDAVLFYATFNTSGFGLTILFPTGTTIAWSTWTPLVDNNNSSGVQQTHWNNHHNPTTQAGVEDSTSPSIKIDYPGLHQATAFVICANIKIYVQVGSTAGSLTFQGSQVNSSSNSSFLDTGSYGTLTRVI